MRVICYKSSTPEQLSALFNLAAGQVEIEILTLQNYLQLKAHCNLVQLCIHRSYENWLTYICESAFSYMNFIKNKHRTRPAWLMHIDKTENCSVKLFTRL